MTIATSYQVRSDVPPAVDAVVPDWTRERVKHGEWRPGKRLLRTIRQYQRWQDRWGVIGRVIQKWCVIRHRFWSVVCAADIPLNSRGLGGGLMLPHPQGVVIHQRASIGPNCMIFQQVTIGTNGPKSGLPTIGGHVDIGAGAKILGPVTIGDHARIGANAVVLCDVPPGAVAVGIPARVVSGRGMAAMSVEAGVLSRAPGTIRDRIKARVTQWNHLPPEAVQI